MAANEIQIHFVERLSILVCRLCECVVSGSSIERHLRRPRHRHMKHNKKAMRTALLAKLDVSQALDWADLSLPTSPILAIPGLPIFRDGLACIHPTNDCNFVTRHADHMHAHLLKVHSQSNPRPRGRSRSAKDVALVPWRGNVVCQQYLPSGTHAQLFEVFLPDDAGDDTPHVSSLADNCWDPDVEAKLREFEVGRRDAIPPTSTSTPNSFVERMAWPQYLEGFSRTDVLQLARRVDTGNEPVLHFIHTRMSSIVHTCIRTADEHLDIFFLLLINRTKFLECQSKPFNMLMRSATTIRYIEQWSQMLHIILRLYQHELELDLGHTITVSTSDFTSDRPRLPKLGMNSIQREKTQELLDTVEIFLAQPSSTETETSTILTSSFDPSLAEQEQYLLCPIDWQILQWCICLFDSEIIRRFQSPIVCGMAVMGVTENGWATVESFTPKQSAIIKIIRLMVLQKNWQASTIAQAAGDTTVPSMAVTMKSDVARFMTVDEPTAMQQILTSRQYGLTIVQETPTLAHLHWSDNVLVFKDIRLTQENMQGLVLYLLSKSRQVLTEKLLFVSGMNQLPRIDWPMMRDDQASKEPGYMFTENLSNHFPVDWKKWFLSRLESDKKELESFWNKIDGKYFTTRGVKPMRVQSWMNSVCKLKEYLLVLMHISGGMPARSQEILSIRYSNDTHDSDRNIFIEDGTMLFVTKYHKGYSTSGRTKNVLRYLPLEVSELLFYYLWLVLPNQKLFMTMLQQDPTKSYALWPSDKDVDKRSWTAHRMKAALENASAEAIGVKLNISSYRHIAIAFARKFVVAPIEIEDLDDEEVDEHGHAKEASMSQVMDLQAAHSTHTAERVYARDIHEIPDTDISRRATSRTFSEQWHVFLGFPSTSPSYSKTNNDFSTTTDPQLPPSVKRKADASNRANYVKRVQLWKSIDLKRELKAVLNSTDAVFKSIQEETLSSIKSQTARILAIMATGAGKSLTFMLPATIDRGTTIVVVPMISLRADMMRRCRDLQISCAAWDATRSVYGERIVLVTPESAVTNGFTDFLNFLRSGNRLDRIVLDECHTIFDSTSTFRQRAGNLQRLMTFGCQILMLTATLPPTEEQAFRKLMALDHVDLQILRGTTIRPNISYSIRRCSRDAANVVAEVNKVRSLGKTIVYCRSKALVESLASGLKCDFYHADVPSVLKDEILTRLQSDTIDQVVIATNALGLGIDIPDIRHVYHVEPPDTLQEFAQQSGRAGRDGLQSSSVIFSSRQYDSGMERPMDSIVTGADAMAAFMRSKSCRRKVLDSYLDGTRTRSGCDTNREGVEMLCDICDDYRSAEQIPEDILELSDLDDDDTMEFVAPTVIPTELENDLATYHRRYEHQEFEQTVIQKQIKTQTQDIYVRKNCLRALMNSGCLICNLTGKDAHHDMFICPSEVRHVVQTKVNSFKGAAKYASYACCFKCEWPQIICENWDKGPSGWVQSPTGYCEHKGHLAWLFFILIELKHTVAQYIIADLRRESLDVCHSPMQALKLHLGAMIKIERDFQVSKLYLILAKYAEFMLPS